MSSRYAEVSSHLIFPNRVTYPNAHSAISSVAIPSIRSGSIVPSAIYLLTSSLDEPHTVPDLYTNSPFRIDSAAFT